MLFLTIETMKSMSPKIKNESSLMSSWKEKANRLDSIERSMQIRDMCDLLITLNSTVKLWNLRKQCDKISKYYTTRKRVCVNLMFSQSGLEGVAYFRRVFLWTELKNVTFQKLKMRYSILPQESAHVWLVLVKYIWRIWD